jgi:hypothetical protein
MWLTALIALSFMMRNTSVIGWIPLLGIKVLFEGSLPPFILSAILAGVPVIAFAVYIDTKYYNSTSLTPDSGPVLTSLNFMRINVSEGLAKYFGEDPAYWYVAVFGWAIYTVIYPWMIYAHFIVCRSKPLSYMAVYTAFYVLFFSVIPHKEMRFMLPCLPFTMIVTG